MSVIVSLKKYLMDADVSLCTEIFMTLACMRGMGRDPGTHVGQGGRVPERCGFSDTSDTDGEDATWVDDAVWYDSLWMDDDHEQSLELSYCSEEYCNMMKRRSRDMETETDEELLLLVFPANTPADHSSGSLSSSVSL